MQRLLAINHINENIQEKSALMGWTSSMEWRECGGESGEAERASSVEMQQKQQRVPYIAPLLHLVCHNDASSLLWQFAVYVFHLKKVLSCSLGSLCLVQRIVYFFLCFTSDIRFIGTHFIAEVRAGCFRYKAMYEPDKYF